MDSKMKERLFGAGVLLAITIILTPMLFDKSPAPEVSPNTATPDLPEWTSDVTDIIPPTDMSGNADTQIQGASVSPTQMMSESDGIKLPPMPFKADTTLGEDGLDELSLLAERAEDETAQAITPKLIHEKAWSIQLATFGNVQNAMDLQHKLREAGYSAYTIQSFHKDKLFTRVLVGPQLDHLAAERLMKKLEEAYKVQAMVVPFDPITR